MGHSATRGYASWEDQKPALPTPSERSRSRKPYLDLPANHKIDSFDKGHFDESIGQATSTTEYPTPALTPGDIVAVGHGGSDLHRSHLPTPSPSAHSHASLPVKSPPFPAVRS